jgi:phosphoenolpyruvate phosphomutase
VIVPTKYYATPTEVFREAGFSIAIWANHLLRAAIPAMQACAAALAREQNLQSIEDRVAPVKEIFRLQGASELQEAEDRYLPRPGNEARVIVLAASRGAALGELTADRPKAMVEIRGLPLLSHIVAAWNAAGIRRISVVRGYLAATIDLPALTYVDNSDYDTTGELASLARALAAEPDDSRDLYVSYGDVIFRRYIVDILAEPPDDFVVVVDTDWRASANRARAADYVSCSEPHSRHGFYREVWLQRCAEDIAAADCHGEWMGFLKVSAVALPRLRITC